MSFHVPRRWSDDYRHFLHERTLQMTPAFDVASLELLINTAKASDHAASAFTVIDIPPINSVAIVDRMNKTAKLVDKLPPARKHKLLSITDVVAWANVMESWTPIVWIGDDSIVVTLDEASNRVTGDQAVYDWEFTPEFKLFKVMSEQSPHTSTFQQRPLLQLLRTKLFSSFQSVEQRDRLISDLRNVVASQQTQLTQGKGTFEATLGSISDTPTQWPERLQMYAQVFDDPSLETLEPLDVVFEVNASDKTFSLWPTASSLTKAIQSVRKQAIETIRDQVTDGIHVYAGSPK